MSNSLRPYGLYSLWNSPSQNTGVDSLSLLQRMFLIQESNWGLLHCRRILYQLSYQGSLKLRHLLLGRKTMTNLYNIFKSRNINLLTNVHVVKAIVFSCSYVWM